MSRSLHDDVRAILKDFGGVYPQARADIIEFMFDDKTVIRLRHEGLVRDVVITQRDRLSLTPRVLADRVWDGLRDLFMEDPTLDPLQEEQQEPQ